MFSDFQDSWLHLLKSLDKPNAIIFLYVCRTESYSVWLRKKSSNRGFSSLNLILPRLLSLQLWNSLYLTFTTSKTEIWTSCCWFQGTKYTRKDKHLQADMCWPLEGSTLSSTCDPGSALMSPAHFCNVSNPAHPEKEFHAFSLVSLSVFTLHYLMSRDGKWHCT